MKLENGNKVRESILFEDVLLGECFCSTEPTDSELYIRIEKSTNSCGITVNAATLSDGALRFFDNDSTVLPIEVTGTWNWI
jgi:hypothetical protein